MLRELILYACPGGALAEALDGFFDESATRFGANAAHRYMPHISLTGFFRDVSESIPSYVSAMEKALLDHPHGTVEIGPLISREDFVGLPITSTWLRDVTLAFAQHAVSGTRIDGIRRKEWLHLSLAYEHNPVDTAALSVLAQHRLGHAQEAQWDICFYERLPGNHWQRHGICAVHVAPSRQRLGWRSSSQLSASSA